MTTNILAPFIKVEETVTFYLNGRVYEVNGNEMTQIEKINNKTFSNAIKAFESFDFSDDNIKWYHGASRFTYNLSEGTFAWNNSIIEGNTFSNHVLSAGIVRYDNLATVELFESIPSLLENYIVLDFATSVKNESITVDVFKLDENVYVSRYNSDTKIAKFFKANSANEAVEYVKAETGININSFLTEMLEGEALEFAKKEATIAEYNDIITFLKDQRGLLAEADKSIEEIKAADSLINQEIQVWEQRIADLSLNENKKKIKELSQEFKKYVEDSEKETTLVNKILSSSESDKVKISYLKDEVADFMTHTYYTSPPTQEYYDMKKLIGPIAKEYLSMNK